MFSFFSVFLNPNKFSCDADAGKAARMGRLLAVCHGRPRAGFSLKKDTTQEDSPVCSSMVKIRLLPQ